MQLVLNYWKNIYNQAWVPWILVQVHFYKNVLMVVFFPPHIGDRKKKSSMLGDRLWNLRGKENHKFEFYYCAYNFS